MQGADADGDIYDTEQMLATNFQQQTVPNQHLQLCCSSNKDIKIINSSLCI